MEGMAPEMPLLFTERLQSREVADGRRHRARDAVVEDICNSPGRGLQDRKSIVDVAASRDKTLSPLDKLRVVSVCGRIGLSNQFPAHIVLD